jgi:uncharacterized protein (DUF1015 family)
MADIHPFRGIRYNPAKIADFSTVVAPPYDIISPSEQEGYYAKSPHNIIRLILGKKFPADTNSENRYTRADRFFKEWQEEQILVRDEESSLYFYTQEFLVREKRFISEGFFALVRMEEYKKGIIIPHERTLSAPKTDRLKLMRACQANFSPVFVLYPDIRDEVIGQLKSGITRNPLIEVRDKEGVFHQFWRVRDPEILSRIKVRLEKEPLFIADGHHRYETALNYRSECRLKKADYSGRESFNYMMMYLTPLEGKGLVILPYHRVLYSLPSFEFPSFEKKVQEAFDIETLSFHPENEHEVRNKFLIQLEKKGSDAHVYGLLTKGGNAYYILTLKRDRVRKESTSSPVSHLDVTILESLVFNQILGITSERLREQKNIEYCHVSEEAFHLVRDKGLQLAFILNPTRIEEVKEVALSGETMPQKSTYFYPKLLSGLVINRLDPEEEID